MDTPQDLQVDGELELLVAVLSDQVLDDLLRVDHCVDHRNGL